MNKDTILKKLEEKYDPFKKRKRDDLKHWTDSESVCRLSEYLRIHKDQGIRLVNKNGKLTLQFIPHILRHQKERLRHAQIILDLLQEALDDLKYLIRHKLITLPPYIDSEKAENNPNHTTRGSLAEPETNTGTATPDSLYLS